MIKISKKLLIFFLFFFSFLFTSCGNKGEIFKDGVTLEISKSLKEYLIYQNNLPTLHFDYPGVCAMIENEGSACFFVQNDQYKLSDKFSEHLSHIDPNNIITIKEELQKYDNGKAKFGSDSLVLDDKDENGNEQKYSVEKQIVTFDERGTRYSYQFRTFVSNSKRYYIYRYSSNIGISIEEPLMVIKGDKHNNLVLLALPYDTKYEVSSTTTKLSSLIDKDTYLDEHYQKFAYPAYLDGLNESEKIIKIKEWYTTYCHGYIENDKFYFSYLDALFRLDFGVNDAGNGRNQAGFKLTFID